VTRYPITICECFTQKFRSLTCLFHILYQMWRLINRPLTLHILAHPLPFSHTAIVNEFCKTAFVFKMSHHKWFWTRLGSRIGLQFHTNIWR
jgi:hypothetical protein